MNSLLMMKIHLRIDVALLRITVFKNFLSSFRINNDGN